MKRSPRSPHSKVPGLGDSAPPIFSKARERDKPICDSENSCQILRIPDSLATKLVATFSFEKVPFWLTKAFWWAFLIPGFLSVVVKKAITPPNWDDHIRMRYHAWSGHELVAHFLFHQDALLEHVCLFHPEVTVLGFRNVEDHSKHCWKSLVNDGFRMKWAYLSSFRFMVQNWLLDKFSIMAI